MSAVFIDLSKPFDMISHDILKEKIENLGNRGIANKWVNIICERAF
jgi:hypothetical protein